MTTSTHRNTNVADAFNAQIIKGVDELCVSTDAIKPEDFLKDGASKIAQMFQSVAETGSVPIGVRMAWESTKNQVIVSVSGRRRCRSTENSELGTRNSTP